MEMHSIRKTTTLLMAIILFCGNVFAADYDTEADSEPGVYTGEYREGIPLDDFSGRSYQPGQPRQLGYAPGSQSDAQSLPRAATQSLGPVATPDDSLKDTAEPKKPKPRITLTGAPGDGLVSLNWTISGLQARQGDSPVRYTVFYGTESGRYNKKIELGSATEYRLRELKNHQLYFMKVQGIAKVQETRDGETETVDVTAQSNEIRLTPLPVEEQGSRLERAYSTDVRTLHDKMDADPLKRELKQFGYDFFQNGQAAAVASETTPVGADYVIGPGDELRIELWGSLQARHESAVDRNGQIFIPRVGTVKVWGLTYSQAKEAINQAVGRYYKGYELNVTLGSLRSVQVFVVGEVEMPGAYVISSLGTIINALSVAGGPTKNGSLRTILITRNGKQVQAVDLYDMFLSGDRSKDIRLESGDTVFVPVVGAVAAVAGEVKRPGIYELKGPSRLGDVIGMAGGIAASGDSGRIQVERIEGNSARVILDFDLKGGSTREAMASVEIRDRDMIKVFPVRKAFREVVSLRGHVARPGEYQFRKGMRISDIIPSFDLLLPDSYLASGEILRLMPPDFHREPLSFNLKKAIEGDEPNNILLQEQDTIRIFSRAEMGEKHTVLINGLVMNPGSYDHYPKMTVRELITAAGSLKRSASLGNAELTRISVADGTAKVTRMNFDLGKALAGDPEHNLVLQPDDTLVVRGIMEWTDSADSFVTLKGEVKFPGIYSVSKGEKLSSVISRAGGYSDKAYLQGAKFTRRSVRENQQKRMDEVIARTEQDILKKQGELASLAASREELDATKSALEGLMKSLDKLKTTRAEGRVVIRLAALEDLQQSPYDLEMLGGDVLDIPPVSSVVNVMGQVYNPTSFVHMPGDSISSYLKKAGGPTREAEEDDMYVIKADGTVSSRQHSGFGIHWDESGRKWSFGNFMSRSLEPGETLVVPQKLDRIAWMREIKDITTIISQIALTAGVIIAAGL